MTKRLLCNLIVTLVLASACSTPPATKTSGAGALNVLAAETFLGDIAQNVAGNRLRVETLLPVGVDPHEFQPTARDAIRIARSHLLIVNGVGYETWLAKMLEAEGSRRLIVVASAGLTPNPDPRGEHPTGDPHLWMNPSNVIRYVENIRDGLVKIDPTGEGVYRANAEAYTARLKDLDQWAKRQIARLPQEKRLLVTNHDTLGYFAQAYDFEIVGVVIPSLSSEAAPSAQQLASLIETIRNSGVRAIFLDVGENSELANQIAAETGVRVVADLYIESLSPPDGPAPTYIDMIRHDVTVIVEALK